VDLLDTANTTGRQLIQPATSACERSQPGAHQASVRKELAHRAMVGCLGSHKLGDSVSDPCRIAQERFGATLGIGETQTAFDVPGELMRPAIVVRCGAVWPCGHLVCCQLGALRLSALTAEQ
jgi:hypothetical protein